MSADPPINRDPSTPLLKEVVLPPILSPSSGSQRDTPVGLQDPSPDDRLLILDVDGLFIKRTYDPSLKEFRVVDETHLEAPRFRIEIRKGTRAFLEELFARIPTSSLEGGPRKQVALWTSSKASTFGSYLPYIFGDLYGRFEFVWDRQMCDLDPAYGLDQGVKVHATVKPLSRVLSNPMINEHRRWRVDNVTIVDDSATKLRFNPEASSRVVAWEDDLMTLIDELF